MKRLPVTKPRRVTPILDRHTHGRDHAGRPARRYAVVAAAALLGLVLGLAPVRPARAAVLTLVGAGSTFVAPFFTAAFAAYEQTHTVHVTYQSIGSGGGIVQFMQGTVDFAASDAPLDAAQLARAGANRAVGGPVVQAPVALGGEAIIYNLPALAGKTLRLDGPTTARIFLGAITLWDDPAIRRLNPGLALPHQYIVPVHRLDGSGTTYILTDYLSAVSPTWAATVGTGLSVQWPTGLGGAGNGGVAAAVVQQPGAIGYVELTYAIDVHLPYAHLKNRAGASVVPTPASVLAAASQFPRVTAAHASIVDAPWTASYPIAGYSWALVRSRLADKTHRRAVAALFRWVVTPGQRYAAAAHYVPLPAAVRAEANRALDRIAP